MYEVDADGENITQFFSYDLRVVGGFRVSSVKVGYDIRGPGPNRLGDLEKISSIAGYTDRRSIAQSPMQAYLDLNRG